jgi:glycosyltransferase involved in cell wall biosynthesis
MLTPAFWPEVRRGTERMVHELSTGLLERGWRPTVVTSHPGRPGVGSEGGIRVLRLTRPPQGRLIRRGFEEYLTHVPLAYGVLRAWRPDVAHAWFVTDALAAGRYGRGTGRPVVHSYMGIPDHRGLMWRRRRLELTLQAIRGADVTVALSRHAADEFARWLDYEAPVIPPPVDVDTFRPGSARTPEPTAVCAAVMDEVDGRKRVGLLVRAWPLVRRERPRARLLLNRPRVPALAQAAEDPASGIEIVDMDDRATLAGLYGSAWVSVLPSWGEAFGLVLAEAMACGTPGVGSNCDGIPEVIESPEVGRLFDGDDERALARAILEGFELAADPATAQACRARAMRLSRAACTDAYERLYRELLERR